MEFKVRFRGNTSRIRKDIKKLESLNDKNKDCLKYLVIMDCKASRRSVNTIIKDLRNRPYIIYLLVGKTLHTNIS